MRTINWDETKRITLTRAELETIYKALCVLEVTVSFPQEKTEVHELMKRVNNIQKVGLPSLN